MKLAFKVSNTANAAGQTKNTVYLSASSWDDYSFVTTFGVTLWDGVGQRHVLGQVKIGYIDQPHGNPPDRPKAREVEFSKKEVLREEVKIYRQPNHGCAQAC